MGKKKKLEKKIKNFKILGAKNHRKYLHKHSGPPFQIRGGPGSFSIAQTGSKENSSKALEVFKSQNLSL